MDSDEFLQSDENLDQVDKEIERLEQEHGQLKIRHHNECQPSEEWKRLIEKIKRKEEELENKRKLLKWKETLQWLRKQECLVSF